MCKFITVTFFLGGEGRKPAKCHLNAHFIYRIEPISEERRREFPDALSCIVHQEGDDTLCTFVAEHPDALLARL